MRPYLVVASMLLLPLLASACDLSKPTTGEPIVRIGAPYDVSPSIISLKMAAQIDVPVSNPRDRPVDIQILDAVLTVAQDGAAPVYIAGLFSPSYQIPAGQSGNVSVVFKDIPVVYQLRDKPLRLAPVVRSYRVYVRSLGTITFCVLGIFCRPMSQQDEQSKDVDMKEIPIPDNWFKLPIPSGAAAK